jgi:hypothetical protein
MNYYAQGGQAHGLKSLAQELPKYGRNGDTIVAHINPQEAGILKALGGSGTINPHTGLPEFGFFKSITNAVKGIVQPVYNATLKNIPGVDNALVGLDKAVGNTIPGGWNTLVQTGLAFTPLGLAAKVGLAALGGSGAFGPNGKFNLQRALMSGAMAYGANQLTAGLQAAGGAGADATASQVASNLGVEGASSLPGSQAAMLAEQASGMGQAGLGNIASSAGYNALPAAGASTFAYNAAGEMVPANIAPEITGASANIAPSAAPSATNSFLSQTGENLAAAGRGIQNLSGFGSGAGVAATNFAQPVTTTGMTALAMGTMGTMQLDEQQKALDAQLASGSIAQSEYDAQAARIAEARARAEQAVRDNPYQFAKGGEVPGYAFGGNIRALLDSNPQFVESLMSPEQRAQTQSKQLTDMGIKQNIVDSSNANQLQDYINAMRKKGEGEQSAYRSMINNPYQYAAGGSVDDEYGMDEARGLMQGNLQNGFMGGGMPSYAKGGETKERRDYLDMMDAELRMPPSARYVEGVGFESPPPSVGGRVGANFDALGGNIRAGVSGNAMMGQDRRIMARPEMMDIGYKGQVGPGELDVGLQRAIQSMPGRAKDYALNAKYSMNFADGGNVSTPRFLSGGGDGMSDSIPATINGKQEARLADGEFVVPADVVSHLGNGSSKAGAKRLYSMMDKVRSARTGTKKQAPAVNTNRLMPA